MGRGRVRWTVIRYWYWSNQPTNGNFTYQWQLMLWYSIFYHDRYLWKLEKELLVHLPQVKCQERKEEEGEEMERIRMKIGAKTKQFLCFIPPKRKLNDFRKLFKKSTEESWGSLWFGCCKVLFSRDHHWWLWIRTGIFTVFPINFIGILMEKCLRRK